MLSTILKSLKPPVLHAYVMSMGGYYSNGPFNAGVAYESNQKVRGPGLDDWALSAAANWNFGFMKLAGVYERLDYDTPTGSLTRNFWDVSATVPIGPGELFGSFGAAGNGSGTAANGTKVGQLVKGDETSARQWSVSYTYALSKRTLTYVGFVQTRNANNAAYNFNINPFAVTAGNNASGFVAGLTHFF